MNDTHRDWQQLTRDAQDALEDYACVLTAAAWDIFAKEANLSQKSRSPLWWLQGRAHNRHWTSFIVRGIFQEMPNGKYQLSVHGIRAAVFDVASTDLEATVKATLGKELRFALCSENAGIEHVELWNIQ